MLAQANALVTRFHQIDKHLDGLDIEVNAGLTAAQIGQAAGRGAPLTASRGGRPVDFPRFAVDEIARLFS